MNTVQPTPSTGQSSQSSLPPSWEKAKALSTILAAIAVPVAIAIAGNSISRAKDREELALKYVTYATTVLQTTSAKDQPHLRQWAIKVIDHFSPVPLPDAAQTELALRVMQLENAEVALAIGRMLGKGVPLASVEAPAPEPVKK